MRKVADKAMTSFFIYLVLILLGFISAVYLGIFLNSRQTLDQEIKNRGRSIIETIIFARKWNARHGGVYVKKTPGVTSNPYLENPDLETAGGEVYTKKNPALMVREITEIIGQEGSFQLTVKSLKPLNPGNAPNAFEEQALRAFEAGLKEVYSKERQNGSTFFQYMVPLIVEESCLECHGRQGYGVGDVRGGINVRFNIDDVEAAHTRNLYFIIALALASFFFLSAIIYRMVHKLRSRLRDAEARLRKMAITDELTGLRNRRYLIERLHAELARMRRSGKPLSCILFDLDHFKHVNDTYGHEVGDRVLREIAEAARHRCRESDILSRFGGEEFLVVLPDTNLDAAKGVAERLRQGILSCQIPMMAGEILTVTASFGVAEIEKVTQDIEEEEKRLLKRADDALYEAKAKGRNRVEWCQ